MQFFFINEQFLSYKKGIREIPILDLVIILPEKRVTDVPVYFIITCLYFSHSLHKKKKNLNS